MEFVIRVSAYVGFVRDKNLPPTVTRGKLETKD
jgi:hypothetical protein